LQGFKVKRENFDIDEDFKTDLYYWSQPEELHWKRLCMQIKEHKHYGLKQTRPAC
jgi:hypothetical protein